MLRHAARALALTATTTLLAACGSADAPAPTVLGQSRDAIQNGKVDTTDTAVVGIAMLAGGGVASCSGELIAPNVVLTARHCVAPIPNEGAGGIICSTTKFGAPYKASSFYVTTHGQISYDPNAYRRVSEVRVVPGGDKVCGFDVAVLILDSLVPDGEAHPIAPRVDAPPVKGEPYSAIGFGATCEDSPTSSNPQCGYTAGTRRRRDGLSVDCVGLDCKMSTIIMKTELQGEPSACSGDSGGPMIDAEGQIIGVLSRGGWSPPDICDSPVYSQVAPWKDFLVQAVLDGAAMGGYAPPAWAAPPGSEVDAGPQDDGSAPVSLGNACTSSDDCPSGQVCVSGDPNYCTVTCGDQAPGCPEGWSCTPITDAAVCTQNGAVAEDDTGSDGTKASKCSVAPGRVGTDPTKPTPWIVALALVPWLRRRRRAG